MSKKTAVLLAALVAVLIPAGEPRADDTGVAQTLHSVRREGNRLCLAEHTHDGSSSGQKTRKAAEAEAIKSWAGFTAWEYGTDWAYWSRAAGKRVDCSQSAGSWGCQIEARPSKQGR